MSPFEVFAALVSAAGVWLTARRSPWCWPVGLVSVVAYAWIFVDAKLYSDMLLQAIFAVLILYGWHRWLRNLDDGGHVRVAALSPREALLHLAIGGAAALALGYAMHRYTDASLPWLDAALTAFSLVAQWWQARRHAAAWWLWIAVDVFYVGEYVYKSLPVTAVLYVGFIVLAAMGLKAWRTVRYV
ncbi:nicotinamide mononucleotide transporter [Luteibacter yeojuensis]|uniref:Nicotinamide riboside transporter PnuC n=1 Tax=Luteibacter yeojuensis TaxID=345309 RepID=A0A7X5TQ27_9GAMM|nr:nicotinamide riboside transporter PnuC [Luteibacter yeojuensis]NID16081.1 nicotinamide mononucleotide transporter [Luteibacter yeojuensis]